MSVKFANNAFGTLSAGITASGTSITLSSGQGARFPSLSSGEYFYATLIDTSNNLEVVKVTARSSDVLTATRAQENTTARAFVIGDRIELRVTAAGLEDILDAATVNSDSTPQLGGNLDTNGNNIEFGDDDIAKFGDGDDLQIQHDGSNSYIDTSSGSTGDLYIRSQGTNHDLYLRAADDIFIQPNGNDNGITVEGGGEVKLYHNNVEVANTQVSGFEISSSKNLYLDQYNVINTTNYASGTGASGTFTSFASVQRHSPHWYMLGMLPTNNPGSGGTRYIHIKTNLISTSKMCEFLLQGYNYNYGYCVSYFGLYMYSGSSILNKSVRTIQGGGPHFDDAYKASGGELCFRIDLTTNGYTSAACKLFGGGMGSDDDSLMKNFSITSITRSNSTSNQY